MLGHCCGPHCTLSGSPTIKVTTNGALLFTVLHCLNTTFIIAQRVYIWSPCYSIGLSSLWYSYHHSCTKSPRRLSTLLPSSTISVSLTSLHVKNLPICTGHPLCSPLFPLAHAICALVILFSVHSFFSVATSNQILVPQTSLCALSIFDLFSNHFTLLPSVISSTLIILISFASQKPRVANRPGMAGIIPELTHGVPCPGRGSFCPGNVKCGYIAVHQ